MVKKIHKTVKLVLFIITDKRGLKMGTNVITKIVGDNVCNQNISSCICSVWYTVKQLLWLLWLSFI